MVRLGRDRAREYLELLATGIEHNPVVAFGYPELCDKNGLHPSAFIVSAKAP